MSAQAEIKEAVRVAGTLLSGWRRTSDDTDPDWELTTNEINSYVRSARESLVTLEEGMAIIRSHHQWLCFDDDLIEPIEESQIRDYFGKPDETAGSTETGYILFYEAE